LNAFSFKFGVARMWEMAEKVEALAVWAVRKCRGLGMRDCVKLRK